MSSSLIPPPGASVFTPEQIRCLEEDAILLPHPQRQQPSQASGKRKVSAAFTSSRSVSSSSSSSSASVETRGFQPAVVQTFDIPMAEESVAVLQYIGFVEDTANLIYNRYINRPDPDENPDDLMAYVSGHLASLNSSRYNNVTDGEALSQIGFDIRTQQAILDPSFSHVFGTETLHYWAKDTVETNYAALVHRQRLLREYANKRITHKKKHKESAYEASSLPEQGGSSQQQAMTATINITPSDFNFPEAHVATRNNAEILDDHLSLYKGKSYEELVPPGPIINDDGSVNLSPLATFPGGDFNWNSLAHHWTPEYETAEQYRKYAARRCPTADTCIIHIQIPQSFIDQLAVEDVWYSRDWKQFVWTCRRRLQPDRKFDRLRFADAIRGHLCSSPNKRIMRISQDDVQTQINEENVMRLPSGKKASQWMFASDNAVDRLSQEIRGKMHFTIFENTAHSTSTA